MSTINDLEYEFLYSQVGRRETINDLRLAFFGDISDKAIQQYYLDLGSAVGSINDQIKGNLTTVAEEFENNPNLIASEFVATSLAADPAAMDESSYGATEWEAIESDLSPTGFSWEYLHDAYNLYVEYPGPPGTGLIVPCEAGDTLTFYCRVTLVESSVTDPFSIFLGWWFTDDLEDQTGAGSDASADHDTSEELVIGQTITLISTIEVPDPSNTAGIIPYVWAETPAALTDETALYRIHAVGIWQGESELWRAP